MSLRKGLLLSSAALLLSFASCKKYTELNPINSLSESTAFTSPANIELVMAGVYNTAAVGSYNGGAGRGYPFGAASIEQAEMRGEDMVNLATFYQLTYESLVDPTTANNVNMWVNLYALINQCNVMIEGVKNASSSGIITAAVATQYEAEARFLRALAHHELVLDFCRPYVDGNGSSLGIPYRTVAVTSTTSVETEKSVGRGTVAEDYAKILADLDFAETNLPATRASQLKITRAVKGAAIALKTRVKLHMNDFAGVITEGAKLGAATDGTTFTASSDFGSYALTATPDAPFAVTSGAGTAVTAEAIFSIENSSAANGGTNGALPAMFGPADKGARGLVATSPNLYNASFWVSSDTRRSLMQVQQTTTGAKYYFNYKYRDYVNRSDYAPIIRYAEVLLNVAEAYTRGSAVNTTRALNLLNAIRNRAVATADRYTAASFASTDALTQAILNERRIEFAGEGRRWPDITRLSKSNFAVTGGGVPAKLLVTDILGDGSQYNIVTRPALTPNKAALPYTDFHYIWPIPADETTRNPNIPQNPGY